MNDRGIQVKANIHLFPAAERARTAPIKGAMGPIDGQG